MLDVHPPHSSAHNWRDFFIHIATICIGLLIAIGLEQAVEALHHHHQRVRLEEDMRAEAEQNIRIIQNDFAVDLPQLMWLNSAMRTLRDAPVTGGAITATLPPAAAPAPVYQLSGNDYSTAPSHSVWTVAQSTGQAELLPLTRAKVYDRLEREAVEYLRIDGLLDVESTQYSAALRSLNVNLVAGETLHLTAVQRDELVRAVNTHLQMLYWDDQRLAFWKGASIAVLNDVQSPDEVFAYMARENNTVTKP